MRHIRDMADRVEREGVPSATRSMAGTPRYANAAEQVLHALAWDVANMSAYRLVSAAAHADAAEASLREVTR